MFQSSVDIDKKIQKQQEIYKRIKLLGTGSYGKAYLVKQIKTDQQFVIKQILMADMNQQEQQNALKQAKILEALSHPNIIKFKQVYRTSKMRLNIVMQFADEGDLATKIKLAKKESRYFDETQILDWFTQICLGIKHIHDRKIIHRDLKAENIFLTSDKIVKIGDFGVSRVLQKTAMNARTVVGSPYYLSPQIIQNKPYSFQTDIWSLGALLYQMCALCPPFVANNLQFLALKIVKGAYGQIPNQYSYDLKSLIKSMLNTDSSRRPNINKILTSKVISKRISNFLTESKRMDEFSHTIIHNKNIFQNNLQKYFKNEQKILLPPPNLMNIEKDIQNKSQICLSNVNFDIENEVKSRPYTPLVGQQRKGPNNFFNNNNRKPSQKNFSQNNERNNFNFNDLMHIKPSALEQKVKLPKVNTNPTIFDRRQSDIIILKNESGLNNKKVVEKHIPNSAFNRKRVQSKQISQYNAVISLKKQMKDEEQKQEYNQKNIGKWKKPPVLLQKIDLPSSRIKQPQNNFGDKKLSIHQCKIVDKEVHNFKTKQTKDSILIKQLNSKKVIKKSESKRIIDTSKKNSVHTQKKQVVNQKKTPASKKSSRKQSIGTACPAIEIISQEMKKKGKEEQKNQKISKDKSSSKLQKDKKNVIQKKNSFSSNNKSYGSNNINKPPSRNKIMKKANVSKGFQKLAQPPRLQFQNQYNEDIQSPEKKKYLQVEQEQIVQEQKCNSQRSEQQKTEQMYSHQQFEQYEDQNNKNQLRNQSSLKDNQQEIFNEAQQKLSLNLSDSCKPRHQKSDQNQNYNRMLDEMQNIKNMIALANGIIDTLPMFENSFERNNILQLSQRCEQFIRQDDSELDSILKDQKQNDNIVSLKQYQLSQQILNDNQLNSNSSGSSNCQANTNLTLLSNQQHLQTLKMNLEEIFGEQNIIFTHGFLTQVIQKQGLDFQQKDIQKMILFQKPQINSVLLKKYFRLIVTVIIMQQQQNIVS